MLPGKIDPRWRRIVTGEVNYKFKSVPAAMCAFRLTSAVRRNGSPKVIEASIDELHTFFTKYESVLKDDIAGLFGA